MLRSVGKRGRAAFVLSSKKGSQTSSCDPGWDNGFYLSALIDCPTESQAAGLALDGERGYRGLTPPKLTMLHRLFINGLAMGGAKTAVATSSSSSSSSGSSASGSEGGCSSSSSGSMLSAITSASAGGPSNNHESSS